MAAVPPDVRKGSAFPRIRLNTKVKDGPLAGKPQAFRTSSGTAATTVASRFFTPSEARGTSHG